MLNPPVQQFDKSGHLAVTGVGAVLSHKSWPSAWTSTAVAPTRMRNTVQVTMHQISHRMSAYHHQQKMHSFAIAELTAEF